MEPAAGAGDAVMPVATGTMVLPLDALQRIINLLPLFSLSNVRLVSKQFLPLANTRVKLLHIKASNTQIRSQPAAGRSVIPQQRDHISDILITLPDDLTSIACPAAPMRQRVVKQRQGLLETITHFLRASGPAMHHPSRLTLSASPLTHLKLLAPLSLPGWSTLSDLTLTLTPAEDAPHSRKAADLAREAASVLHMLHDLPSLKTLALHGTSVECADISTILPALTSLTLSGQAHGKSQLDLPHLRQLKLSQQPLSPTAARYPYRALTALQQLQLRYCHTHSQDDDSDAQEAALLNSLSQLTGLTHLQISEKQHFAGGAWEAREWSGMSQVLQRMPHLQRVSFLDWTIDSTSLQHIAAACFQLTHLGCLSIEGRDNWIPTARSITDCNTAAAAPAAASGTIPHYPVLASLWELEFGELGLASGRVPCMQRLAPGLTSLTLHGSLQLGESLPAFVADASANGALASLSLQSHCFTKEVALACKAVAGIQLGFVWEAACDDSDDWDGGGDGDDDHGYANPEAFYDETGEYDVDAMYEYEYENEMMGMRALDGIASILDPGHSQSANDVAHGVHALASKDPPSKLFGGRVLELRVFGGVDDGTRHMEERSLVRMVRVLWRTGWKGEPGLTLVIRGLSDEDDCQEVGGLLMSVLDSLQEGGHWAAIEWVDCQGLRQDHVMYLAKGSKRGLGFPIRVLGCRGISERECDAVMEAVRPRSWGRFCVEWAAGRVEEGW